MFFLWAPLVLATASFLYPSPVVARPHAAKRDEPVLTTLNSPGTLWRCFSGQDEHDGAIPPTLAWNKRGDFNPGGYLGYYLWGDYESALIWCEGRQNTWLATFDWNPPSGIGVYSWPDGNAIQNPQNSIELDIWKKVVANSFLDIQSPPYTGSGTQYQALEGPLSSVAPGGYEPNLEYFQFCLTDPVVIAYHLRRINVQEVSSLESEIQAAKVAKPALFAAVQKFKADNGTTS